MKTAPLPANEKTRLEALRQYGILDTLPEPEYDRITRLASIICGTPIAVVSLVDENRQWFKSTVGLDAKETPRSLSFCAHAILEPDDIFIVPDALKDDRFFDNPIVSGDPKVRFYAGCPLTISSGESFGALCVVDMVPRTLTKEQKEALKILAEQAISAIELRTQKNKLVALAKDLEDSNRLMTREISERLIAESKLREISEMYQLIVESSPDLIFVKDSKFRFVKANRALLSAFPEDVRDKVIGTTALGIFTPEEAEGYLENDRKAFKEGHSETIETAGFGTGKVITLFTKKVRFTNANGEEFILGIARDITDMKEAEEAQRLGKIESTRLLAMIQNAPDFIGMADIEGNLLYHNKAARLMVGLPENEDMSKRKISDMHPAWAIRRIVEEAIPATYEKGVWRGETALLHVDGHEIPVSQVLTLYRDDDGNPVCMTTIMQDITERKRLEKLKVEFVSTVSHELRTPLTSIRGSLGLMKAGVVGELPAKAMQMTEIAFNNAERLILLINDILDIDKIESGEMRFDLKEYSLTNLVDQAIEAVQPYGEKFGISFVLEPLEKTACVLVDANRFIQVLSNLLSNAAKFSAPGDEVRVRMERRQEKIRVSIIDKGPGIPDEFRARIFSKFAQADSSSSRQKGGTGLGLNISKQLVEQMKGTIGFVSETGKGSTFWIDLPERVQEHTVLQAIEYLEAGNLHSLPLVLHVEDDKDFRRILAHSLQGKALMHSAATLADAEELLKANIYQLVIIDIELPDGKGLLLLERLQRNAMAPQVIILSASEVSKTDQGRVALALVKSRVSEDKIVESILALIDGSSYRPYDIRSA